MKIMLLKTMWKKNINNCIIIKMIMMIDSKNFEKLMIIQPLCFLLNLINDENENDNENFCKTILILLIQYLLNVFQKFE